MHSVRMALGLLLAFLPAAWGGCTYSLHYVMRVQASEALNCDCDPLELKDITNEVREAGGPCDFTCSFLYAKCCGREAYYECKVFTQDSETRRIPLHSQEVPAGDVYWRCWETENPIVEIQKRRGLRE